MRKDTEYLFTKKRFIKKSLKKEMIRNITKKIYIYIGRKRKSFSLYFYLTLPTSTAVPAAAVPAAAATTSTLSYSGTRFTASPTM